MMTHEWSRHADAIEDAREAGGVFLLERALRWAETNNAVDLSDYRSALDVVFCSEGVLGGRNVNRALEVIIDAYLTDQERRAA